MAYLLHPRHLSLEFCLPINIDNFELSVEGHVTKGGPARRAPGLRGVHGNKGDGFEVLCYCSSDGVVIRRVMIRFTHLGPHPSIGGSSMCRYSGLQGTPWP